MSHAKEVSAYEFRRALNEARRRQFNSTLTALTLKMFRANSLMWLHRFVLAIESRACKPYCFWSHASDQTVIYTVNFRGCVRWDKNTSLRTSYSGKYAFWNMQKGLPISSWYEHERQKYSNISLSKKRIFDSHLNIKYR